MIPTNHHLHPGYNHDLTREWQTQNTKFDKSNFVYPIFVVDVDGQKNEIKSMPGQYQWSVDRLTELLDPLVKKGLRAVILFGVISVAENKDENGKYSTSAADSPLVATWADSEQSPVIRAITLLRKTYPELYIMCDVCLCQYTSHGHCGLLGKTQPVPTDLHPRKRRRAEQ